MTLRPDDEEVVRGNHPARLRRTGGLRVGSDLQPNQKIVKQSDWVEEKGKRENNKVREDANSRLTDTDSTTTLRTGPKRGPRTGTRPLVSGVPTEGHLYVDLQLTENRGRVRPVSSSSGKSTPSKDRLLHTGQPRGLTTGNKVL